MLLTELTISVDTHPLQQEWVCVNTVGYAIYSHFCLKETDSMMF